MSSGGQTCAVVVARGLGFGLAAGVGHGALTGLPGCLAAVLGFSRAAGADFAGAWALAAAGLLDLGTGLGACLGGFPRGLGGGLLDEDAVMVADELVVVVDVVDSEVEESTVGDGGGSWAAGGGRRMLGPVSNEDEGAGSGTGCVRALSLVTCVRAGVVHMYVAAWWRCLGCAGKWVIRAGSTSAPGRVGAFAGGS